MLRYCPPKSAVTPKYLLKFALASACQPPYSEKLGAVAPLRSTDGPPKISTAGCSCSCACASPEMQSASPNNQMVFHIMSAPSVASNSALTSSSLASSMCQSAGCPAASPSEAPVQARRRDSPGEISVPERRNQGLLGAAKQTCPLYRNTVPLLKSTSPMAFISPVAPANLPVPPVRCRGYVTIASRVCESGTLVAVAGSKDRVSPDSVTQ